jgi:hypothetical protein
VVRDKIAESRPRAADSGEQTIAYEHLRADNKQQRKGDGHQTAHSGEQTAKIPKSR